MNGGGRGFYSAGRVRRALMHFFVGRGVAAALSFVFVVVVVRELSVDDYAGYTAISGLLMVIMLLSNGGLERMVPRYVPEARQCEEAGMLRGLILWLFRLRLYYVAPFILAVLLGFEWIAGWFGLPVGKELGWAVAAWVLAFAMGMHLNRLLQSLLLQKQATTGMVIEWFAKLALLLAVLHLQGTLKLIEVVWIQAATMTAGAAYMGWRLITCPALRDGTGEEPEPGARRRMLRLGLENYVQTLTDIHNTPHAGKLVSAAFLPAAATAAFGFAHALIGMVKRYLPANLMLGLIEPVIMARYSERGDFTQASHLGGIVLKLNLFVLAPLAAWMAFDGALLIDWISDGKYGRDAWMVAVLLAWLMLESDWLVLKMLANAVEESGRLIRATLWTWLLVPPVLAGIFTLGAPALVVGSLVFSFVRNALLIRSLARSGYMHRADLRANLVIAGNAVLAALIASRVAGALAPVPLRILASLALAAGLYLLLSWLVKPFRAAERETLNRFFGRRLFVW